LGNDELEQRFGKKEIQSISKLSGIRERRVVPPDVCASDLAYTAAERLLTGKDFDRSRIDLLIFVSQTPDYRIPATASVLHGKLGLPQHCATFDVNQSCSAYPHALAVAHSMIVAGVSHYALLLNADTITRLIHPMDRSLVALHGDAACATLVGPCAEGYGLQGFSLGSDGKGAHYLRVPAGGFRDPSSEETRREFADAAGCLRTAEHLYMDGPSVFHFSVYRVPEAIREAMVKFQITMEDVDLLVLHQANQMMLSMIYKSLKVPPEKQFYAIEEVGNSSGPSTAVTLAAAWQQGRIKPGSRTLICSFGAGLTWGVTLIRWPEDAQPHVQSSATVEESEVLSARI
jgi:3-oxoacyl-[acyl-carrier-protein] synthase-3